VVVRTLAQYRMSYSPIQQVRSGVKYPAMLLCSGLNDPRVAYLLATASNPRLAPRHHIT
jgi:protease II